MRGGAESGVQFYSNNFSDPARTARKKIHGGSGAQGDGYEPGCTFSLSPSTHIADILCHNALRLIHRRHAPRNLALSSRMHGYMRFQRPPFSSFTSRSQHGFTRVRSVRRVATRSSHPARCITTTCEWTCCTAARRPPEAPHDARNREKCVLTKKGRSRLTAGGG